jgi:hypothetical protein
MGFVKAAFGLNGTEKVADRIIAQAETRRAEGRNENFWTEYSQREIGFRVNASMAWGLIGRRIGKAGLTILKHEATGNYGGSVRLLIGTDGSKET